MALEQLPGQVREFAQYLSGLLARLDQGAGWCGVFWQRDPDGMRACLEGYEVPPWDVVEALFQDLATEYGTGAVTPEAERARALHQASLTAFDTRPGARDTLGDRLDVMLREQKYAAERLAELGRLLASAATHEEAQGLRLDLAWARDDHERASARCVELRSRLEQLARRAVSGAAGPRRDRDEEADLFAGRVQNAPHPVDPLLLPRQRTETEEQRRDDGTAAGYDDERTAGRQGADGRPHTGYEDGRGSPRQAPDGPTPARHGHDPGRQGADGDGSAWRDGSRRSVHREALDGARHGDDRSSGGQGGDGDGSAWRDGSRPSARPDAYDGTRPAARQAGAPGTPEHPAERTAPQIPADWYEPPASVVAPEPEPERAPKQRSRRRNRGGARFAGMTDDADTGATPTVAPAPAPAPAPAAAAPAAAGRRTPRGARFAGAAAAAQPAAPKREALDDDARHDTIDAVRTLVRLRSEGHSGEAHALLVEAAHWPAARFPLLAAELHRAGLGADWATLLWEAASLPADRLVAAADALVAAGRGTDGQQILRQGMARPAQEVGDAVLGLVEEGRQREVRALLDAYVRVRTPEEAARSVAADPQRLVPLLLEAARGASEDRYWDLVHALRVAGHSA
ncbi:hypothetical protein RB628_21160 [Streptomyces sp. ADMS]|uniref:hypothetical protein n=1 Tax=Streptomyces sp. ADMS TaxID=3071415 RepID=UPI00296EB605|nr:hypothetical protein [Streptomyces sp. ADMS]MDW4907791.1 hypothetical protein [Streptomyces sp. ADMS]